MNESFYIIKSDTNFHPLSWISQIIIKTRFSILRITRQDVKYLKVDETIRIQKNISRQRISEIQETICWVINHLPVE